MMRIKEILKEKKISVNELSERLGVSRQALSKQINGKLLVETAERIANALEVPLWQLFTDEMSGNYSDPSGNDLHAVVDYRGRLYKATTIAELENIVNKLKSDNTQG